MYHSKVLTARVDIKTKARERSSEKHLSFSQKDDNMIADFDARFWHKLPFTVRQGEATCLWRPRVWFSSTLMTELDCVKLHILWTCWRHVADAAAAETSAMEWLCAPNGVSDIAGMHSNHVVSILFSSATLFHQRTYVVGMALYPALAALAWYIDLAHRFTFILGVANFQQGSSFAWGSCFAFLVID